MKRKIDWEMVMVTVLVVLGLAFILNALVPKKTIVSAEKVQGYVIICNDITETYTLKGVDTKGNTKSFYFKLLPEVKAGAYKVVSTYTKGKSIFGFVSEWEEQSIVPVNNYEKDGFYDPSLVIEGSKVPCYTWNNSNDLFKDAFAPLIVKDFAETVKTVFAE